MNSFPLPSISPIPPGSGLKTEHPEYCEYKYLWCKIRDAYKGEEHVKCRLANYLPPTTGQDPQGMSLLVSDYAHWGSNFRAFLTPENWKKYKSYLDRAEFPDKVSSMVVTALGILWNRDATIELPARLEYLRNNATSMGETLQDFMMRVNIDQLLTQRCGLLVDLPPAEKLGPPNPYLCLYCAESIINWDAGYEEGSAYSKLNLVVLDESQEVRISTKDDPFSRVWQQRYRVLSLGPTSTNEQTGNYRWGQFINTEYDDTQMKEASLLGSPIPYIPFFFINGTHCLPCIEKPRAIELANKCFSYYRNSADYEQMLHEQAQETLVIQGGDPEKKYQVGSGATLCTTQGNDAKFIGLSGKGLPEMRAALANKATELLSMSGNLIDTRSLQRESGEALSTRIAAQTATLASIARTCGEGITKAIKAIAVMVGANPDEVKIKPNTTFLNPELFSKTIMEMITAKNAGFPVTTLDLHRMAQERGITQLDFDAAMKLLKQETNLASPVPIISNPGGQEPDILTLPTPATPANSGPNPTGVNPRGKARNNNT